MVWPMRALTSLSVVLVLSSCGGVVVQTGHEGDQQQGPTIADVSWLVGRWVSAPDEHGCVYHEVWRHESDVLLTGHSHATCEPLTEQQPFDEDLRVEAEPQGLVYVAWPSGQDRTSFDFSSGDANGFVAENPDHDFPTRIEYRHTASGFDAIVSGQGRSFTLTLTPETSGDDSTATTTTTTP